MPVRLNDIFRVVLVAAILILVAALWTLGTAEAPVIAAQQESNFLCKHELGSTILSCFGIFSLVIAALLAWNRSLKLLARQRTDALETIRTNLEHIVAERTSRLVETNTALLAEIADLARASKELTESQQMLEMVLNAMPARVFWKDRDSRYLGCNHRFAADSGLMSPDQVAGKSDHEMVWADLAESLHLEDREIIETGEAKLGREMHHRTPEGGSRWVRVSKVPLVGADGNVRGILGTHEAITNQKLVQEARLESQQQFANIIDFLPDATFAVNREGKVIAWNRAMENLTGVAQADMIEKANYEHALPFYGERRPMLADLVLLPREEVEREYVNIERNGGSLVAEAYMPAFQGGERYLFVAASVLCDLEGNIVGAIQSIRDITGRRRMEEALAQAEEKYRSIFENAVEGIYQSSLDGRFIRVNPSFARILEYDSSEEVLETITDIPRQLYVEPARRIEIIRQVVARGSGHRFEVQFFRKDRSIAWVNLNMHAVRNNKGDIAFLEGTIWDISDHKAWESKLAHSQKMEAIGTLAGGIAHDFNNILMGVIGYTELIASRIDDDKLMGFLEQILRSCDRAKNLVSRILTFSRKSETEIKPINMGPLVKECVKLLRATLPSTIEIRTEISPQAGIVNGDQTQLHQVLMNLCTNAAHSMRDRGGTLLIGLEPVIVDAEARTACSDLPPGKYVSLRVSDTGTGISPSIIDRIFDPFFTTKDRGQGTGLGLSVVYGIVKDCRGAIAVDSKPDVGSSFNVFLPAAEEHAAIEEKAAGTLLGGNESILFVDDEPVIVTVVRTMLQNLGYRVVATTSSTKALRIFQNHSGRFDLIVTDMTMPGMTGIELSKEIWKVSPDIPIVLCTGFSELITDAEAKVLGIREFIMKPFTQAELSAVIRKALDRDWRQERGYELP